MAPYDVGGGFPTRSGNYFKGALKTMGGWPVARKAVAVAVHSNQLTTSKTSSALQTKATAKERRNTGLFDVIKLASEHQWDIKEMQKAPDSQGSCSSLREVASKQHQWFQVPSSDGCQGYTRDVRNTLGT